MVPELENEDGKTLEKIVTTTLRQYQVELVKIARERNSIIFLPTGAGKTFIALHVLRSRLCELRNIHKLSSVEMKLRMPAEVKLAKRLDISIPSNTRYKIENKISDHTDKIRKSEGVMKCFRKNDEDGNTLNDEGKIAIFLGTTKPLVKQLATVIEENTNLKVKVFLGEMGVDNWTLNTWVVEMSDAQVFCMTPAIFLFLVERKIVTLDSVSLLVLDECHHAILNHPYNMIMKEFEMYAEQDWPLILGLTSTVLNSNPEGEGLEEVEMLKKNLKSSFAKTEKVEDAIEYGTSPIEIFVPYKLEEVRGPIDYVVELLRTCCNRLEKVNIYGVLQQRAESIVPGNCTLLHNKNVVVKEIRNMFRHLTRLVQDLGLYATTLGVLYFIIRMERLKFTCQNPVAVTVIKYGITVLNLVRRKIFKFMQCDGHINASYIRKFSSPKVLKLIEFVEQIENKDGLTCIIVVEERVTAAVMASLFNELSAMTENDYYKADFVTGGMFSAIFDQKEAIEEQKRMKDILRSFRKLGFHFLFATDVVEEGIDLPDCNVVIKFDEPKDYRSYVQCKGRARSKNSQFVLLHKSGELRRIVAKTAKYSQIQQNLLKTLHSNDELPPRDVVDEEEEEEMFFLDGPDGLHISGTRAIQFLIRYCSHLPQDNYSFLAPLCWYDNKTKTAFLQMPSSCPLQKVIEGDPKRNRKLAKKNVYLKAVKELYRLGEITKNLTFRSYKCNEEDNLDLFPYFKKENFAPIQSGQPGTSNKKRTYDIIYAENLSKCLPLPGENSYIHVIKIAPKTPRPRDSRQGAFYDLLSSSEDFAIVTSKRLSKICDFSLYFNHGDYNCSLLVNARVISLNKMEIEKLKRFHFFIFHSLLSVIDRLQVFDTESEGHSFLIVPIQFDPGLDIKWDLIDQFVDQIETIDLSELVLENPTIEDYYHSVVYPKYRKTSCSNKYYIVTSLDRTQTPLSEFPSEDFKNYCTYYEKKYQVKILNTSSPLLEVKLIPTKINYLKPKKSQMAFKSKRKYQEENETFQEHLVPELCCRLLVPSALWLKATMLPSALYRITVISCIDDMRKTIVSQTNLGVKDVPDDFDWEPLEVEKNVSADNTPQQGSSGYNTTKRKMTNQEGGSDLQAPIDLFRRMTECAPCDLKHYVKYYGLVQDEDGRNRNLSRRKAKRQPTAEVVELPKIPIRSGVTSFNGPQLCDFVKVFTCKSANDIVDLERLEFFGDSFLKFATAFYLFRKFKDNEGVLVGIKDKIIGNRNLYYCALEKGLQGPLLVNEFEPKSDWNAPLFSLPEEIKSRMNEETNSFEIDYLFEISIQEKLSGKLSPQTIKSIEDFVEMKEKRSVYSIDQGFFGRKVISDKAVADCVEALIGLYVKDCGLDGGFKILNWLGILPSSDGSYEKVVLEPYAVEEEEGIISTLLSEIAYEELEKILGYRFRNKFLLLQALTHPSFLGGPTSSYQRLEFLGDSVLDFLMTIYIYHYCTKLSPGQMTDIRSALVNNLTFACLTVKYNIHKYLLHHSQQLLAVISQFANFQKSRDDKIDPAVLVLNEEGDCRLADSIEVPKALGDVFESIAGAVFLDSGNSLESVWNIFFGMMRDIIDEFSRDPPKSPVRVLYETCKPLPEFTCTTLDDGVVFTTCKLIYNDKEEIFYGRGRNTERSKLSAAKLALRFLEKAKDEIF